LAKQAKSFNEATEIIVNASPTILSPIIKTVVTEFELDAGLDYIMAEESKSASEVYRKLLIIALEIKDNSQIVSSDCIGIITLQSLGNDQTLFRIPPQKDWHFSNAPDILDLSECKGLVNKHSFNLRISESYFTKIIEKIISEFYRLSLLELKAEKPPLGFNIPNKE
jgi:hypothetical protein